MVVARVRVRVRFRVDSPLLTHVLAICIASLMAVGYLLKRMRGILYDVPGYMMYGPEENERNIPFPP